MKNIKQKIRQLAARLPAISGSQKYLVLPAGIRWGNILYFLLDAHTNRHKLIARDTQHEYWMKIFPEFTKFFISEKQIGKLDYNIPCKTFFQEVNELFTKEELDNFISTYFLKHPKIQEYKGKANNSALYINVRRGDYYGTEHEKIYGFDIVNFIKHCFQSGQIGRQSNIIVISDDSVWCATHLSFLKNYSTYLSFLQGIGAEESFFTLCAARKLLISNSTFCYWAAYISSNIYKLESEIYAPNFVNRIPEHQDLPQYLKQWSVIRDFDFYQKY